MARSNPTATSRLTAMRSSKMTVSTWTVKTRVKTTVTDRKTERAAVTTETRASKTMVTKMMTITGKKKTVTRLTRWKTPMTESGL